MGRKKEVTLEDLQLLNEADVAKLLRVSRSLLKVWRRTLRGPRYYTMSGRAIRYRLADIQEWQRASLVAADPLRL